jgi:peptidoglycan/LPS O-acetylase OafA/YrhL
MALASTAPPEPVRASERYYRPELDVLRFFAFLSVYLYHILPSVELANHAGWSRSAAWLAANFKVAGSFGVCLFFVLSSFLITELLLRERRNTGTVHVQAFYARRILRIWPLYFSFLFFGALLGHFVSGWHVETPRLLAFLALLGNWYVSVFSQTSNPIAPLWSISIEEQFYLTWPWLAKTGGRNTILTLSILLLPISWLTTYLLAHSSHSASHAIWYSSLVQFEFFGLGALTALLLQGRVPHWKISSRLIIVTGAGILWMVAGGFFDVRDSPPPFGPSSYVIGYQLIGLGCILFLLAFLDLPRRWTPRPLIYLGKISYGLYVFHYLCRDLAVRILSHWTRSGAWNGRLYVVLHGLAVLVIALLLTIILAASSYRFLEQPFLRLKKRFTFIDSRAA